MKIGLFCAAGFSTGMLVNNMKVAAQELGIDAEIEAYSQAKLVINMLVAGSALT